MDTLLTLADAYALASHIQVCEKMIGHNACGEDGLYCEEAKKYLP